MQPDYRATRHACYTGYIVQAIVVNLAPLFFIIFQQDYGLSYRQIGWLVLLNFVTQFCVDAICIKLIDYTGYRAPLVAAHGLAAAGLLLLGILPSLMRDTFPALAIAVVTYAVGGGLLEVLISPVVDSIPSPAEEKAASMSLLHSFYCWGQMAVVLVSTLLLALIGLHRWRWLTMLWALVPLWNMLRFLRVPVTPPVPAEKASGLRSLLRSPAFFAFLLLMLCSGASELTIAQWASLFAEQGLGVSKMWGDLLGPAMFALLMGAGRVFYGLWGAKLRLRRVLALSGALCVICYLGVTLVPNPLVNLLFCALSGLSVSLMWPGCLSLASRRFPRGSTALFATLALMGDMGCSLGPWVAGVAADAAGRGSGFFRQIAAALPAGESGLAVGILTGAVFPVAMLAVILALRRDE